MTSLIYPKAKEAFASGGIDLTTADIRVILVDLADYTYAAAHDNLDDVAAAARVAVSTALASKTVVDGVFNAAAKVLFSVTGDQSEALIIYKHTGTESTSTLIAYIDSGAGLPYTPSGGNITVTWDSGASKIFAL